MMCFREGCSGGINGPGSVEVSVVIGTRGNVGASEAKISFRFCSIRCAYAFMAEHPSQGDILDKVNFLRARNEK